MNRLSGPSAKPTVLSRILAFVVALAAIGAGFFFFTFVLMLGAVAAFVAGIWWFVAGKKKFAAYKQRFQTRRSNPFGESTGANDSQTRAESKREGVVIEGEVIRRDASDSKPAL